MLNSYTLDVSQWWGFCLELLLKLLDSFGFTLHLNLDILGSVINPSLKVVFNSQSIDERAEAYALNNATDANRY